MTAYVIFEIRSVTDPEKAQDYGRRVGPVVEAAGGRYLVRGGEVEVLEGVVTPGMPVVIAFPDMEAARAWHGGADYAELKALRQEAMEGTAILVPGLPD